MLLDLYIETNFHDFLFLLVKLISNQQGCDGGNNHSKRVGHQSRQDFVELYMGFCLQIVENIRASFWGYRLHDGTIWVHDKFCCQVYQDIIL
ncbi:hypothetical protein DVH24_014929 [Malus domestica]|uniref:Uncharacterized protein n=1 Tax=Malus domestica TaxID=3750 RepID=A0A498K0A1_MALDO|nr:hypothetical protein DVH24_014929 [Malus domestica]